MSKRPPGSELPQRWRLLVVFAYGLLLLGASAPINGTFPPAPGLPSLWLTTAFLGLLLGSWLAEARFTRPLEAMVTGIALAVVAAHSSGSEAAVAPALFDLGVIAFVLYGTALAAVAATAMLTAEREGSFEAVSRAAYDVIAVIGRSSVAYSVLLFAATYAAFGVSNQTIAVYLLWALIFVARPLDRLIRQLTMRERRAHPRGGVIERVIDPGVAVVRLPSARAPRVGTTVDLGAERGSGVVVGSSALLAESRIRVAFSGSGKLDPGKRTSAIETVVREDVIGRIAEGTTLETFVVESNSVAVGELAPSRLLSIDHDDGPVLCQVVEAKVLRTEDAGDHAREWVQISARHLGRWNDTAGSFELARWLPRAGALATLVADQEPMFRAEVIGYVPRTTYGVRIDVDKAVTHNTAILGVLGSGKTYLGWELVRRMLAQGIKVVVLDISGRYSSYFSDVLDAAKEEEVAEWINRTAAGRLESHEIRDGDAGNVKEFREALGKVLEKFATSEKPLLILNPTAFRVTRMEGYPSRGEAQMLASLTMVEVTRCIAEKLLELAIARKRDPKDESAWLCLVLEEAHSLVPEFGSVSSDAEKQASNGTARAVLQGRKYGYGCLVITQRTANVTKSILNQCNTTFALRVFDATGMEFLSNYVGKTYSTLLPTLEPRQAVVYGVASSCRTPVVVRVNDEREFADGFWVARVESVRAKNAASDAGATAAGAAFDGEGPQVEDPPANTGNVPT